ncbi:2306_t:CDS:2 [Entrophospora sp. SA101]|nr:11815_t:CDS:2 [Entrophospora sp. SA101]CAJ0626481.1 9096_t:CDS:2 [Entrophospora sp. SA101]CAJ0753853.1 2306_t:CDS:2 [Entrophospora sp. SA101]CAJ0824855.1 11869_t:CDS:2 [Entrophospora sp. SA101]CAJ0834514.1 5015_t:CDS:2 [Entrophospora sp. SA101]
MSLHHKIFSSLESLKSIDSLLIFFLSLVIIYVTQFYYKYYTRINPLPGPFPLPLIGNSIEFHRNNGNLQTFLVELNHRYGAAFEVYIGGSRRIIFCDVEHVDKLCSASKNNAFLVRMPYVKGFDELGIAGKGIIMNYNVKSWRYNRQFFTQAILSPGFDNKSLDWTIKLLKEMEKYWQLLKNENDNKIVINLESWIHRFTHDVISVVTTGERAYSMACYLNTLCDKNLDYPSTILGDSERFIEGVRTHFLGAPFFIAVPNVIRHYFPMAKTRSKKIIDNRVYLSGQIDKVVKKRRKEIENIPLGQIESHDMLTSMLVANTTRDFNHIKTIEGEELNRPLTDEEIGSNMLDAFLGGTDTTANLFCVIAYFLAKNPLVKKKMVEEIDSIFDGDKTREITHEDLSKLRYCDAVIKEVDRLVPISNTISRYSTRKEEVGGYEWPAGTFFNLNIPAIHRNPKYWKEPETFNPDRFLNGENEIVKNSFMMFGAGLRICPGRRLAILELKCLMASIYRNYDLKLVDENARIPIHSSFITMSREILVYVVARE